MEAFSCVFFGPVCTQLLIAVSVDARGGEGRRGAERGGDVNYIAITSPATPTGLRSELLLHSLHCNGSP